MVPEQATGRAHGGDQPPTQCLQHYPTSRRKPLSAAALGLTSETADGIRHMELLAEDDEQFLRVIFVQLRSITAKARNELVRNLGNRDGDHLLILTKDFEVLEFVLIDKETRRRHGPGGGPGVRVFPRIVTVIRKASTNLDRRILRRLTWTGKDGLDQFDKLRSVFEAAHYSGMYFQNRALFADHYLETRLREDAAWGDDPSTAFAAIRDLFANARGRFGNKPEQTVRDELYQPVWKLLGFKAKVAKAAKQDHLTPDYELHGTDGTPLTVAFVYRWDRWLDGPDLNDPDTPEENPGAAVVTTLTEGKARWVIVTNGKCWRLYSRDAHSRSTNFYEVDLEEALLASGESVDNSGGIIVRSFTSMRSNSRSRNVAASRLGFKTQTFFFGATTKTSTRGFARCVLAAGVVASASLLLVAAGFGWGDGRLRGLRRTRAHGLSFSLVWCFVWPAFSFAPTLPDRVGATRRSHPVSDGAESS